MERFRRLVACLRGHVFWVGGLLAAAGCGTTQTQLATQQLILSDAVDRAVARLDFRVLAGQKVYLDDRYIQNIKGLGFVNSEYIISALRQQMLASGCLLQESPNQADVIVEARVGTLGHDQHDVTYGIPANKTVAALADIVPNAPDLPNIPEISLARRSDQLGAAKIAAYAYDRKTREAIWQSGTSIALSDAKNSWLLGIGPFQTGSIYPSPRFAGERLLAPFRRRRDTAPTNLIPFQEAYTFSRPAGVTQSVTDEVQPASHQTESSPARPEGRAPANRSGQETREPAQTAPNPAKEDR
ncbi:MAG: hypothetical protein KatS3mg110_3908 [Pirellulaceae bacterium]|nr:MAG: hypothetical protein KatS3mg110_3908 [Pirellulaceae bacterium]